jgi:hypothetical protein
VFDLSIPKLLVLTVIALVILGPNEGCLLFRHLTVTFFRHLVTGADPA